MMALLQSHPPSSSRDVELLRSVRGLARDDESADLLCTFLWRYGLTEEDREWLFVSLCNQSIVYFDHYGIDSQRVRDMTQRLHLAGVPVDMAFYEAVLIETGIRKG